MLFWQQLIKRFLLDGTLDTGNSLPESSLAQLCPDMIDRIWWLQANTSFAVLHACQFAEAAQYLCDLDNHGTRWDIQQRAVAVRVMCWLSRNKEASADNNVA